MAGIAAQKDSARMYVIPKGSTFGAGDKLTNIKSIGDIGPDTDEIDSTCIDSLNKESIQGFSDYGTQDIEQNITQHEFDKWMDWKDANTTLQFGFVANDLYGNPVMKYTTEGWIKSVKATGPSVGALLTVKATIRINKLTRVFDEPARTPIVSAGVSLRKSETEAVFTFVTNEYGKYYIGVVEDGAAAPTIDTSGTTGTALYCNEGENIVYLAVTAGAKDVYVKVKSPDNSVSEAVKIDVKAFA